MNVPQDAQFQKKIVILLGAPLTSQNFERIGIPHLSKHLQVIVYDCTILLGRDIKEIPEPILYYSKLKTVSSIEDLNKHLEQDKPNYALDAIGFVSLTKEIINTVNRNKAKYLLWSTGPLPVQPLLIRCRSFYFKLARNFNQGKNTTLGESGESEVSNPYRLIPWARLLRTFVSALDKLKFSRQKPFVALLAGQKSLAIHPYSRKSDPILWIGSQDYYSYKREVDLKQEKSNLKEERYILFIDENIPSASDWLILRINPPVNEDSYYSSLTSFFDSIEGKMNLPVIIAGHPNSSNNPDFVRRMGGRTVVFSQTARLALESELVLVHTSTATSFAVLAKKPILVMTTRELDRSFYGASIRSMAHALGAPLIFIESRKGLQRALTKTRINLRKYARYENNYLRAFASTETAPWEALIKYVQKN
jgi:hypothetical protein